MNNLLIKTICIILLIISIFIILSFWLARYCSSLKNRNRIKDFSVDNHFDDDDDESIADKFIAHNIAIVSKLSTFLSKSSILKKYSQYFDKYLSYIGNRVRGMNFIAIKFLSMLGAQILYIISTTIKYINFNFTTFVIISLFGFFIADLVIIYLYRNKRKLIEEQLLQAIVIMNSAFKSGKNIIQALTIVKDELPNPINEEFKIIYADLSYGLSIDVAFERFYNRVKIEEAKYISASLSLLSKTGGSIVTVFNMIEENFYDRLKIKNELSALTSSSKFLYRMLLVMPIVFVFIIIALDPNYFNPFINSKLGYVLIGFMIIIYLLYIFIIKKVMKVEQV